MSKIFLSMCDIKVFLTFTFVAKILQGTRGCWWRWFTINVLPSSLDLVLCRVLFYLFCSTIVINAVIVTAGTFERNANGRFGAVKSDSTHHFFGNACTKSGPLRVCQFSVVDWFCLFVDLWVLPFLWKIAWCSVILLLPLWSVWVSYCTRLTYLVWFL